MSSIELIVSTLMMLSLRIFSYHTVISVMLLLVVLLLLFGASESSQNLIIVAIIGGIIGDLLLQTMSFLSTKYFKHNNKRSKGLRTYFESVGRLNAVIMATVLCIGMILQTNSIYELLEFKEDYQFLGIGILVGVLWGVVAQYSKAGKPMLAFYTKTSGYLENRLWDATTVPFIWIIAKSLKLNIT